MIAITAMFPVMVTDKLAAVKSFYETNFGFQTVFYDAKFYLHLLSPQSGVQLGFLLPDHPTQPEFLHPVMQTDGYVISFEVADALQAFNSAMQDKLSVALPLTHEAWGQIHFIVTDPAGIQLDIVQQTDNQ